MERKCWKEGDEQRDVKQTQIKKKSRNDNINVRRGGTQG